MKRLAAIFPMIPFLVAADNPVESELIRLRAENKMLKATVAYLQKRLKAREPATQPNEPATQPKEPATSNNIVIVLPETDEQWWVDADRFVAQFRWRRLVSWAYPEKSLADWLGLRNHFRGQAIKWRVPVGSQKRISMKQARHRQWFAEEAVEAAQEKLQKAMAGREKAALEKALSQAQSDVNHWRAIAEAGGALEIKTETSSSDYPQIHAQLRPENAEAKNVESISSDQIIRIRGTIEYATPDRIVVRGTWALSR